MNSPRIETDVLLSPYTTIQLGGAAQFFTTISTEDQLLTAVAWAQERALPLQWLGGGSNLIVADEGVRGLVVAVRSLHLSHKQHKDELLITAAAGVSWDEVVAYAVQHEAAGIECLSGIPGCVGATPIQNVGAYGQEISEVLAEVQVYDCVHQRLERWTAEQCAFSYRSSVFKSDPSRWVVTEVVFRLKAQGDAQLRYEELARTAQSLGPHPSLAQVRALVLSLRRKKSMVLDTADENRRSVGSFFLNPLVSEATYQTLLQQWVQSKHIQHIDEVPHHAMPQQTHKLSAAWLIERAGLRKGYTHGNVGISSRHALCLVNRGGGTTNELLQLARHVQRTVYETLGVRLRPEPVFWGFAEPPLV